MPLAELIDKLGVEKIDGSSVDKGVPYQNIPGFPVCHRDQSDWRAERICEIVDVKDRNVLDLGCNVGTMCGVFKKNGATFVQGVDHDGHSLAIAKEIYPGVNFLEEKISLELLKRFAHVDIVVWTSQFMWMVKQHGMEYALDFLYALSQRCNTLVFETAGKEDGLAPLDLLQEEILPMLIKNTCFQDIRDYGSWGDGWAPRNVFVCRKPRAEWNSEFSSVERMDRRTIKKTYLANPRALELMHRELLFLESLHWKYFPKIVSLNQYGFTMEYSGIPAAWIPENDLTEILAILKANNITHRDIRPENILWNGEHCVLIDFPYAVLPGDITNHHYNLGGDFKSPHGFNDEFSFRKTQRYLMEKA